MTDENSDEPITIKYSSNSKTNKVKAVEGKKPAPKRVTEPVVTGKVVQEKRLRRKFAEAFTGDEAGNVGEYIVFDVIIPSVKAMIFDGFTQGLDKLLFGRARGASSSSSYRSGHTSYSSFSNNRKEERREISRSARATHNFDDIVLESRAEAQRVVDTMVTLVQDFDAASVEDLYDCVGITAEFTDAKWGWTDLRDVEIRRVRDGYRLDFPKPIFIE